MFNSANGFKTSKKMNKDWLKTFKSCCVVLFLAAQINVFTGCQDDLPADSYYTFTGEMMSDFLKNREDFSLFRRIVERAGKLDFLGTRGARTLFPPINSGVEAFLKEKGYASVEDIPVSYCNTLLKSCLVERIIYTYDLGKTQQENNQLDLPLIIQTDGDTLDANHMVLSIINRRAAIINELKNDSVENGVVHPVDKVLIPNTSLGATLLDENHSQFSIFYEALRRTGLLDSLTRYQDESYEIWKEDYPRFKPNIVCGHDTDIFTAKRPDHRYSGFTLLIVPDEVLYEKYSDRFNEDMTMGEKIDALYRLAEEKYDGHAAAEIFGLNKPVPENPEGKTYKQLFWNKHSLTDRHNPLNMFLSYHILDRLFESTAKLVNCWGVHTQYANPTEWISTLLDFSTIKLEKVYSTVDPAVESPTDFYINHSVASIYNSGQRVRGAHLSLPDADNFSLNVAYYYVDDVLAYDETMRNNVMNTRMRIDFYTVWPELTNNKIRLCGNVTQPYGSYDNTENGTEGGGYNYYIPSNYIKGLKMNENAIFFAQRPKIGMTSAFDDCVSILGTYDLTFQLPNVPPGTYELRLGYGSMPDRGIVQMYVDNVPQGLPLDMREEGDSPIIGGLYNGWNGWRNSEENANGIYTSEELEENARVMKNNGYYCGPKSLYSGNDGTSGPQYSAAKCTLLYNLRATLRRKICNVNIKANTPHTMRIRSVFTPTGRGVFHLDYIELVPLGICGPGGLGEDQY